MSLPQRVQDDLLAAEALEAQFNQERAQPSQAVQNVSELTAPLAVVSAPPQIAEPPPASPKEDFEQKYRTLQGKYAAEVPTLSRQVNEANRRVNDLDRQLQELQRAKPVEPPQKLSTDPKDVENFGADLIEMVQRYAERKSAEMESRIAALEQQITGVSEKAEVTLEQQFYATLDQLVPQWRQINGDSRWLTWLGETDPVYGAPRQAALNSARTNLEVQRVAAVFNAFLTSLPEPVKPGSLANQVAPTGSASSAPAVAPAKTFVSEKAIKDFYNDLGRGRYAGRQSEADAIEAVINSAIAEGRVR